MGLGTDREGLTLHEKTAEIFCHGSVSPSPGHAPAPPGHVTTLACWGKAASDGQARWPGRAGAVPGGQHAFLPACPARISRPGQTTSLQQQRSRLGRDNISFRGCFINPPSPTIMCLRIYNSLGSLPSGLGKTS